MREIQQLQMQIAKKEQEVGYQIQGVYGAKPLFYNWKFIAIVFALHLFMYLEACQRAYMCMRRCEYDVDLFSPVYPLNFVQSHERVPSQELDKSRYHVQRET